MATLHITATATVTVITDTPELLELEASYSPASKAPPTRCGTHEYRDVLRLAGAPIASRLE